MNRYRWFCRLIFIAVVLFSLAAITIKTTARTTDSTSNNPSQVAGTGNVDDANIHFIGRWDWVDRPWLTRGYWPGVYFTVNFTGTANIGVQVGGAMTFYAQIDNGEYTLFSNVNGTISLASNLELTAIHVLKVAARSEQDVFRFQRLIMDATGLTLPSAQREIVEFVGDSTTFGKGSSLQALTAYPRFTVDNLGADYVNISFTGVCLVDGVRCGWFTGMSRAFFNVQTVPHSTAIPWDFSKYTPRAVVINLGTNDAFYNVTDEQFESTYITFLQNIRAKYPSAALFAMRTFSGVKDVQTQNAVNARRAAGDTNVYYVNTSTWLTSADFIDTYHLNDAGNAKVGQYLAAIIRPFMTDLTPTNTPTPVTVQPTNTATPVIVVPTNTPVPTHVVQTRRPPPTRIINLPTPTRINTRIPTVVSTALATATRTPAPTNLPERIHINIHIHTLCSPSAPLYRSWRIENKSKIGVTVTWKLFGTDQQGTEYIPAHDDVTVQTLTRPDRLNALVVYVNGIREDVAFSTGRSCHTRRR
jgi:hypothetical protein